MYSYRYISCESFSQFDSLLPLTYFSFTDARRCGARWLAPSPRVAAACRRASAAPRGGTLPSPRRRRVPACPYRRSSIELVCGAAYGGGVDLAQRCCAERCRAQRAVWPARHGAEKRTRARARAPCRRLAARCGVARRRAAPRRWCSARHWRRGARRLGFHPGTDERLADAASEETRSRRVSGARADDDDHAAARDMRQTLSLSGVRTTTSRVPRGSS